MQNENLLIEVRDRTGERVGVLGGSDLIEFAATVQLNGVGSWNLRIPRDHPLAKTLATPGAGIVVSDTSTRSAIFSGPMDQPEYVEATSGDESNVLNVSGVTDDHLLADYLAWPDPANGDAASQAFQYDTRTGAAEDLAHAYVAANIGPNAPATRRDARLVMGESLGRGAEQTREVRFEPMLNLLRNLCIPDGLNFRIVQYGNHLAFQTSMSRYLQRTVRFSVSEGELTTARVAKVPPTITRAIVGGYGSAAVRLIEERTNEKSLAAEQEWRRRIEVFIDQGQSKNLDALRIAGDEALADGGFSQVSARFEPSNLIRGSFLREWMLGDYITVEADGIEYEAQITQVLLTYDRDGLRVGASIGDPGAFDPLRRLVEDVVDQSPNDGLGPNDDIAGNDDELADQLEQLNVDLDELNTYTLPQLQQDLEQNINGRFPITEFSIADNAITTDKIAANSINADKILANSIGADQIAANSIGADKIVANSIGADHIVANSIGVDEINANVFNAIEITADQITGGTIDANEITVANLTFNNLSGSLDGSRITTDSLDVNRLKRNDEGGTAIRFASPIRVPFGIGTNGGNISIVDGRIDGSNSSVVDVGNVSLIAPTTGDSGNGSGLRIFDNGRIFKVTSSARYKDNIAPLGTPASHFLALEPKTYTRPYDEFNPDPDKVFIGFIAEEAEALGLDEFLTRDSDGLVDGFNYDTWPVALQQIVRSQQQEIDALKEQVASLAEAVSRLENEESS